MPYEAIPDLIVPTGALGAGAWLLWRLLIRSDRRDRDLFIEIKEQRDHYRRRMERAERRVSRYRSVYGELPDEDHGDD